MAEAQQPNPDREAEAAAEAAANSMASWPTAAQENIRADGAPTRTPADAEAEREALEAESKSKWTSLADADTNPAFYQSTREIAVEGTQALEAQPAATDTKPESGLILPASQRREPLDGNRLKETLDAVKADAETKEAEKLAKEEALRAPLTREEISAVADQLYRELKPRHDAMRGGSEKERRQKALIDGDLRALHVISRLMEGSALDWGNDPENKRRGMSVEERLADLMKVLEDKGHKRVDPDTNAVYPEGYHPTNYYAYARAKDLLEGIKSDPKAMREYEEQSRTHVLHDPDFVTKPLLDHEASAQAA